MFKFTGHTTKSDIPENPIVDNVSFLLNIMCDLGHLGNWRIFGSLEITMNCLFGYNLSNGSMEHRCQACPKSDDLPIFGLLSCLL